jgi:N-acetylglucosaminyldiphosphoundecaprenol N-acetyl-beta-D-mannosaminyltransferase
LQFDPVTESQAVQRIRQRAAAGVGGWVVTPNLDILRQCVVKPEVGAMVAQADLVVADGMPLIWASQIQKTPLPERVPGSNLILLVSQMAAEQGLSIFLLGGAEGTAAKAADVLRAGYPNLKVAGTYYPPFGFEKDDAQMRAIEEALGTSRPDIVFVGLGFPKQERLIQRLRPIRPTAWWMGVGISFSFLCGEVVRAPRWMQACGMEWVHRMVQEPGRLIRRYLIDDIPFAAALFTGAIRKRWMKPRA